MTKPAKASIPGRTALAAAGLALALSAVPAMALGHVSLESSSPQAGENLDTAPSEVTLTFDGELDPTGSTFSVVDHDGTQVGSGEVDLDVADRNVMIGSVEISEPGVYTVEWTVLGADGHEITGAFAFGYATDEEIPETTGGDGHGPPDTAMGDAADDPLTLAGMVMLALAGLVAVRRFAVG